MIIQRAFHTLNIFSTQMIFHVLKNIHSFIRINALKSRFRIYILSNMLHDKYHLQINNWWLPLQRRHMPVYAGSDGETT
jgi:hypothetical protein